MYNNLSTLTLGKLNADLLGKVMLNMEVLGEEVEKFDKLMQEVKKRLTVGIEEARIHEYDDAAKKGESEEILKAKYPDLVDVSEKVVKIQDSLSIKDIEVDVELMNRNEFTREIILHNPTVKYALLALFTPLYFEVDADFAELDELMKD